MAGLPEELRNLMTGLSESGQTPRWIAYGEQAAVTLVIQWDITEGAEREDMRGGVNLEGLHRIAALDLYNPLIRSSSSGWRTLGTMSSGRETDSDTNTDESIVTLTDSCHSNLEDQPVNLLQGATECPHPSTECPCPNNPATTFTGDLAPWSKTPQLLHSSAPDGEKHEHEGNSTSSESRSHYSPSGSVARQSPSSPDFTDSRDTQCKPFDCAWTDQNLPRPEVIEESESMRGQSPEAQPSRSNQKDSTSQEDPENSANDPELESDFSLDFSPAESWVSVSKPYLFLIDQDGPQKRAMSRNSQSEYSSRPSESPPTEEVDSAFSSIRKSVVPNSERSQGSLVLQSRAGQSQSMPILTENPLSCTRNPPSYISHSPDNQKSSSPKSKHAGTWRDKFLFFTKKLKRSSKAKQRPDTEDMQNPLPKNLPGKISPSPGTPRNLKQKETHRAQTTVKSPLTLESSSSNGRGIIGREALKEPKEQFQPGKISAAIPRPSGNSSTESLLKKAHNCKTTFLHEASNEQRLRPSNSNNDKVIRESHNRRDEDQMSSTVMMKENTEAASAAGDDEPIDKNPTPGSSSSLNLGPTEQSRQRSFGVRDMGKTAPTLCTNNGVRTMRGNVNIPSSELPWERLTSIWEQEPLSPTHVTVQVDVHRTFSFDNPNEEPQSNTAVEEQSRVHHGVYTEAQRRNLQHAHIFSGEKHVAKLSKHKPEEKRTCGNVPSSCSLDSLGQTLSEMDEIDHSDSVSNVMPSLSDSTKSGTGKLPDELQEIRQLLLGVVRDYDTHKWVNRVNACEELKEGDSTNEKHHHVSLAQSSNSSSLKEKSTQMLDSSSHETESISTKTVHFKDDGSGPVTTATHSRRQGHQSLSETPISTIQSRRHSHHSLSQPPILTNHSRRRHSMLDTNAGKGQLGRTTSCPDGQKVMDLTEDSTITVLDNIHIDENICMTTDKFVCLASHLVTIRGHVKALWEAKVGNQVTILTTLDHNKSSKPKLFAVEIKDYTVVEQAHPSDRDNDTFDIHCMVKIGFVGHSNKHDRWLRPSVLGMAALT